MYAWYSEERARHYGTSWYRKIGGEEVEITHLTLTGQPRGQHADEVFVSEVLDYIRPGRVIDQESDSVRARQLALEAYIRYVRLKPVWLSQADGSLERWEHERQRLAQALTQTRLVKPKQLR